jgi:hypothetical protein
MATALSSKAIFRVGLASSSAGLVRSAARGGGGGGREGAGCDSSSARAGAATGVALAVLVLLSSAVRGEKRLSRRALLSKLIGGSCMEVMVAAAGDTRSPGYYSTQLASPEGGRDH